MKFTLNEFNKYIEPGGHKHHHHFHEEAVHLCKKISVHANGEKPGELITERRPSESDKIQKYREKIYVPVTKSCFTKVFNSLMKIRKSPEWDVSFDKEKIPASERTGETIEDYLMTDFPKYSSITNWYFQICLKQQLVDTNAKVFVCPIEFEVPDNEYLKPYPFIYNSKNVIDYEYKKYFVLRNEEKIKYNFQSQTYEGERYYVVTDTNIQIFDQYTPDKKYRESFDYVHNLGHIPVYDIKGVVIKETLHQTLYESKIMGMIPFLDEAAREYSDMQAEVVQHVHTIMFAYNSHDCRKCKGSGELISKEKNTSTKKQCDVCYGKGILPFNPFEHYVMGKPQPGETALPNPPIDIVRRDIEIVKLQNDRIDAHFFKAYASINMEFLASNPLNQSGLAKEVDKEELNNFVHGIAEDGVELLDNIIYCINEYRYGASVDESKRIASLPVINVPQRFDLLGADYYLEELKNLKEAKTDPSIINAAETEYANKRFSTDTKLKDMVALKISLDPFAGTPQDTVQSNLAFELIKKEDAIIHANIHSFIERAMEENKNFATLPKKQQMETLRGYAEELLTEQPEPAEEENQNEPID